MQWFLGKVATEADRIRYGGGSTARFGDLGRIKEVQLGEWVTSAGRIRQRKARCVLQRLETRVAKVVK